MKFKPYMTASSFAVLKAKRKRRPASSFPTPPRKSRKKAKSSPLVLAGVTKQANSFPSISRQAIECCLANGQAQK